jgi:hypothetical protein
VKCLCCGADKELGILTTYPYDGTLTREAPVEQLLCIECQGTTGFRMAIMCHECWHKLEVTRGIDMWIGQECWDSLDPATPYDQLPEVRRFTDGDIVWNAVGYQ